MMKAWIVLLGLACACGRQPAADASNQTAPANSEAAPAEQPSDAPAKPFSLEEENDLYIFEFGWPAEVSAVPQLADRFRKEMESEKNRLLSGAREARDERARAGFDYHPHAFHRTYETAGQTDRLLSLGSTVYSFTGGAHGSTGSGALLWDRRLAKDITIADLLSPGTSWTGAIRQPFCVLLDREREKRRGEPVRKDDMFGQCPNYNELVVVLRDSDGNWRFDHVEVIADQYVAGPYAEGPYEISLPITARMIERLNPDYRSAFEARPPVR